MEPVLRLYLEVRVDALESLCIVGQLTANVLAVSEDTVEVGPSSLDRHPQRDDLVSHHQLPLPAAHLRLEVLHIFTHKDVLELHLQRKKTFI